MRVLYPHCRCSNDCQTRYLINKCVKTGQVLIKSLNPHVPVCPNISDETNKLLKKPGISKKYKQNRTLFTNKFYLIMVMTHQSYRRYRDGDINSIDGLLEHVTPRLISNLDFISLGKDESFYFGAEIYEGSEEKHFHLGITSLALLSNVNNGLTFHFDCTYKIVKYGFPTKVLPYLLFITSDEQELDYNFFWKSIIEAMKLIEP
ncbi:hypothetical protein BpHYR1_029197 [Brachionus plicatilis]|uniref:MULE transposase domain-containing protein n=1 Tax=Brachionus plicatilis TaxID=10195 RepID=A0A3M7Q5X5_BRAPC|nr:hypothetical protein BpHYR1_029197 [Brachionus plicatilis]